MAKAEETSILIFENVCGLFSQKPKEHVYFVISPVNIPEKKLYQKLEKNKQGKGKSHVLHSCV